MWTNTRRIISMGLLMALVADPVTASGFAHAFIKEGRAQARVTRVSAFSDQALIESLISFYRVTKSRHWTASVVRRFPKPSVTLQRRLSAGGLVALFSAIYPSLASAGTHVLKIIEKPLPGTEGLSAQITQKAVIVQQGQSLWQLAKDLGVHATDKLEAWQVLWNANRDMVTHIAGGQPVIHPNMELVIPGTSHGTLASIPQAVHSLPTVVPPDISVFSAEPFLYAAAAIFLMGYFVWAGREIYRAYQSYKSTAPSKKAVVATPALTPKAPAVLKPAPEVRLTLAGKPEPIQNPTRARIRGKSTDRIQGLRLKDWETLWRETRLNIYESADAARNAQADLMVMLHPMKAVAIEQKLAGYQRLIEDVENLRRPVPIAIGEGWTLDSKPTTVRRHTRRGLPPEMKATEVVPETPVVEMKTVVVEKPVVRLPMRRARLKYADPNFKESPIPESAFGRPKAKAKSVVVVPAEVTPEAPVEVTPEAPVEVTPEAPVEVTPAASLEPAPDELEALRALAAAGNSDASEFAQDLLDQMASSEVVPEPVAVSQAPIVSEIPAAVVTPSASVPQKPTLSRFFRKPSWSLPRVDVVAVTRSLARSYSMRGFEQKRDAVLEEIKGPYLPTEGTLNKALQRSVDFLRSSRSVLGPDEWKALVEQVEQRLSDQRTRIPRAGRPAPSGKILDAHEFYDAPVTAPVAVPRALGRSAKVAPATGSAAILTSRMDEIDQALDDAVKAGVSLEHLHHVRMMRLALFKMSEFNLLRHDDPYIGMLDRQTDRYNAYQAATFEKYSVYVTQFTEFIEPLYALLDNVFPEADSLPLIEKRLKDLQENVKYQKSAGPADKIRKSVRATVESALNLALDAARLQGPAPDVRENMKAQAIELLKDMPLARERFVTALSRVSAQTASDSSADLVGSLAGDSPVVSKARLAGLSTLALILADAMGGARAEASSLFGTPITAQSHWPALALTGIIVGILLFRVGPKWVRHILDPGVPVVVPDNVERGPIYPEIGAGYGVLYFFLGGIFLMMLSPWIHWWRQDADWNGTSLNYLSLVPAPTAIAGLLIWGVASLVGVLKRSSDSPVVRAASPRSLPVVKKSAPVVPPAPPKPVERPVIAAAQSSPFVFVPAIHEDAVALVKKDIERMVRELRSNTQNQFDAYRRFYEQAVLWANRPDVLPRLNSINRMLVQWTIERELAKFRLASSQDTVARIARNEPTFLKGQPNMKWRPKVDAMAQLISNKQRTRQLRLETPPAVPESTGEPAASAMAYEGTAGIFLLSILKGSVLATIVYALVPVALLSYLVNRAKPLFVKGEPPIQALLASAGFLVAYPFLVLLHPMAATSASLVTAGLITGYILLSVFTLLGWLSSLKNFMANGHTSSRHVARASPVALAILTAAFWTLSHPVAPLVNSPVRETAAVVQTVAPVEEPTTRALPAVPSAPAPVPAPAVEPAPVAAEKPKPVETRVEAQVPPTTVAPVAEPTAPSRVVVEDAPVIVSHPTRILGHSVEPMGGAIRATHSRGSGVYTFPMLSLEGVRYLQVTVQNGKDRTSPHMIWNLGGKPVKVASNSSDTTYTFDLTVSVPNQATLQGTIYPGQPRELVVLLQRYAAATPPPAPVPQVKALPLPSPLQRIQLIASQAWDAIFPTLQAQESEAPKTSEIVLARAGLEHTAQLTDKVLPFGKGAQLVLTIAPAKPLTTMTVRFHDNDDDRMMTVTFDNAGKAKGVKGFLGNDVDYVRTEESGRTVIKFRLPLNSLKAPLDLYVKTSSLKAVVSVRPETPQSPVLGAVKSSGMFPIFSLVHALVALLGSFGGRFFRQARESRQKTVALIYAAA